MIRTMCDGINTDAHAIAALPFPISLVAGYDDGLYAWSSEDWALFPNSVHVHIAVFSTTNSGHVLDVETGDATPAESVDWVLMRRAAGADPSVYCNTSTWAAVRAAFAARGVAEPHYWLAQYDGIQIVPAGAVAKQFTDAGQYDRSVVADYWPGVDQQQPAPATSAATTARTRRNDMHIDLKPNTPVVFTNPAAALGGTSTMLLACDFGDVTVRVATFSFKNTNWTVTEHDVTAAGGALSIPLPADTNKVSVNVTAGDAPVGLDVLA